MKKYLKETINFIRTNNNKSAQESFNKYITEKSKEIVSEERDWRKWEGSKEEQEATALLISATRDNSMKYVIKALKMGANVHAKGGLALRIAKSKGYDDILQKILDFGGSKNYILDETPGNYNHGFDSGPNVNYYEILQNYFIKSDMYLNIVKKATEMIRSLMQKTNDEEKAYKLMNDKVRGVIVSGFKEQIKKLEQENPRDKGKYKINNALIDQTIQYELNVRVEGNLE